MIDVCRQKADFSEKKTIIMQECKHTSGFHMHQMYKIHLERHGIIALPSTFKKDQTTYTMFSETRKNYVLGLKKGLKSIFSASVNATQRWPSLLGHMLDVFADLSLPRGVRQILK